VITNERQHRIAKAELRSFEDAIDAQQANPPSEGVDPRVHEAMGASLRSEADELRDQIKRYEDLRDGRVSKRELEGLRDLPIALIEARIAAGLTQKALAARLGLKEQQIQRWEANLYSGVGVERLQDVADAMGMSVRETVSYTLTVRRRAARRTARA
jgi:ribosome-binding protein aMBF1 (putative translation factor)